MADSEIKSPTVFASDTLYRLTVEAARVWVISHYMANAKLPQSQVLWVYSTGPSSNIGWGDSSRTAEHYRPMQGKRVRVTFEIEDH